MEQQPQVGTTFIPVSKEDDDVLKAEEKKMIMKEKEDGNAGNNHKENDGGFFANKCWNETEEAYKGVWKVVLEYCGDSNPLDIAIGMLLLSTHHRHCPRPDIIMLEEATQLVKHASAAYGWLILCGAVANVIEDRSIQLPPISSVPKNGDVVANFLAMCQYTGVAPDEVLETNWESETFSTGHYVVYDRKLDAIVVSIRGTWSIIDSVADLLAKGVPFAFRGVSGYAHEGVLRCAEKKYAALLPLFNDLDGTRRLIFTGHSLGGGVAILLAMMVAERHPELRVSCTAFAPAPSLTLPLATHPLVRKFVTSFALQDDAVPRLSLGSMARTKAIVQNLLLQGGSTKERLMQCAAGGNVLRSYTKSKLGVRSKVDIVTAMNAARASTSDADDNTFMYPAGRVFYLSVENNGSDTDDDDDSSSSSSSKSGSSSSDSDSDWNSSSSDSDSGSESSDSKESYDKLGDEAGGLWELGKSTDEEALMKMIHKGEFYESDGAAVQLSPGILRPILSDKEMERRMRKEEEEERKRRKERKEKRKKEKEEERKKRKERERKRKLRSNEDWKTLWKWGVPREHMQCSIAEICADSMDYFRELVFSKRFWFDHMIFRYEEGLCSALTKITGVPHQMSTPIKIETLVKRVSEEPTEMALIVDKSTSYESDHPPQQ